MPHSNFKERSHAFNTGVGKCSCGQTFDYASERDMKMMLRMHCRFCSNPPLAFNKIGIPKKATTLKEHNSYEAERIRKVHNEPCGLGTPTTPLISIHLDKYYYHS